LAHHKPLDIGPVKRFFGVPVRFDREQYAIVFSASWLKRPLPGLDPTVRGLMQAQIEKLEAHHADDFAEQVHSVLRQLLVSADPSADRIAGLFSMNRRTMNRRLNALGTTYQQVVDEVSFEIARQMLEHSTMDMAEIAAIFDYANVSAFARAFRRWSGTTPAQWRKKAATAR